MVDMSWSRRWGLAVAGASLVMGGAAAWGEHAGWPWLVQPAADALGRLLGREVRVASVGQQARIHLWRGLRIEAPLLSVSAPAWAAHPNLLVMEDGAVGIGYGALWRLTRGGDVHLQRLTARRLHVWLERDAQGQDNWTFGENKPRPEASARAALPGVRFDMLSVDQARIVLDDAPSILKTTVAASVVPVPARQGASASGPSWQVAALAEGSYRGLPLKVSVKSGAPWQWPQAGQLAQARWPIDIQGRVGRTEARFKGLATAMVLQGPVSGQFQLSGPSLAAVGAPLGVTLPTTAAFRMSGQVLIDGPRTHVEVAQAHIGNSALHGVFDHHRDQHPPLLTGRLLGRRLALADLGPAVGVPTAPSDSHEAQAPPVRMLPDRAFNLPSLSAMNADVEADIDVFDTGSDWLQPMTALKGRIVLKDSVLRLENLSTRLAKGNVKGLVSLDARDQAKAVFHAALSVDGVKVEQWVPALQRDQGHAYLSGDLTAHIDVTGQGHSTAQLLSTLNGQIEVALANGQMSRLGVELAGLDAMQGLIEWVKGDASLPIACARMVWTARHGVLRPHPAIVSTRVTTLWADGSISIPDETLDLRARVAPKDFSLVTLRTPIRVTGPWRQPQLQVLNTSSWLRLLGSAALMTVAPLAGIVPLVDPGQQDEARQADARCLAAALPTTKAKPS